VLLLQRPFYKPLFIVTIPNLICPNFLRTFIIKDIFSAQS
jgi:hypothetical protein